MPLISVGAGIGGGNSRLWVFQGKRHSGIRGSVGHCGRQIVDRQQDNVSGVAHRAPHIDTTAIILVRCSFVLVLHLSSGAPSSVSRHHLGGTVFGASEKPMSAWRTASREVIKTHAGDEQTLHLRVFSFAAVSDGQPIAQGKIVCLTREGADRFPSKNRLLRDPHSRQLVHAVARSRPL